MDTDPPPVNSNPAISSVLPGTENLNKSPQADKKPDNSNILNMLNSNTYTNFKSAYTHFCDGVMLKNYLYYKFQ